MIPRSLEQITEADLRGLIDAARPEGTQLDYKRELPGNADDDKKEFLGDVSSFANKLGGDLLFGIDETRDNNRATGIAGAIVPIPEAHVDSAVLRLEAIARDGLNPRLPDLRIARVAVAGGVVLVLRVGQSFIAPHQVAFQRNGKFFSRNSSGKYQMDVDEIGRAFRWRDALPAEVLQFHRDRATAIRHDGAIPVRLVRGPIVILHAIPLTSFSSNTIDVPAWLTQQNRLRPLATEHPEGYRFNIDGLLMYGIGPTADGQHLSFSQLFRDAVIETAGAGYGTEFDAHRLIPILDVERDILRAVADYRTALRAMNISAPYVIHISMAGTHGYLIPRGANALANRGILPIDRDLLELPSILDVDGEVATTRLLRPAFDALWQASGHERCAHYDANGDYRPGR